MGSSNSVVFKYKDHCLEQKNNNYYWVYYRDGTERARMEVSVEKKIINLESLGSPCPEMGPLIYTTNDHSNDWIVYKNYLPTDSKPINKEKPLIYYKLTNDSVWSQIFYVLGEPGEPGEPLT